MTTTSPGWYDDGHGSIRWWDGANWTEHIAPPDAAPPVEESTAATAPAPPLEQPTAVTEPLYGEHVPAQVAPPYAPGGYPAAYPGQGAYPGPANPGQGAYPGQYDGAFIATTEPHKSRVWIVWVILGVIILGVVVTLAVLTPLLLMTFATGTGPSGAPSSESSSAPPTEESTEEPVDDTPSAADQDAAVDTVQRYNDAWLTGDCDAYMATTTEELREASRITSCETFAVESRNFAGGVDDYETTIGDVETIGTAIAVSTAETYMSMYDAEGNQTAEPMAYEDHYEYILVSSEGDWLIDDTFTE